MVTLHLVEICIHLLNGLQETLRTCLPFFCGKVLVLACNIIFDVPTVSHSGHPQTENESGHLTRNALKYFFVQVADQIKRLRDFERI